MALVTFFQSTKLFGLRIILSYLYLENFLTLCLTPNMGRPRKKQHRLPSIIDSELEHRFSEAVSGSSSDSDTSSSSSSQDSVIGSVQNIQPIVAIVPPPVVPQKRAKPGRTSAPRTPIPSPTVSQVVNYAVSVFTSAEMKKGISK